MISKDQITAIFCIADDFCKTFIETINQNALPGPSYRKIRNKPCKLSDSEVITIMTCFHLSGVRNFKAFYTGYVQKHLLEEFPVTVSYNRFVELSQKAIIPMVLMLQTLCNDKCTGISFIDSTALKVCDNRRIHQHRVFKDFAERGHCSVGYFYGFKLHIIINEKGELINFAMTKGNKHDADHDLIMQLTKSLFGKLYGDKGYLSKSLFEKLFYQGVHIVTKIRRNMKNCLMSLKDKIMLRKRAIIECVNDELKNICQIEHSRHRCFNNFIANTVSALLAYCFLPKKPSLNIDFLYSNQLSL
jgi:hypothetical protein